MHLSRQKTIREQGEVLIIPILRVNIVGFRQASFLNVISNYYLSVHIICLVVTYLTNFKYSLPLQSKTSYVFGLLSMLTFECSLSYRYIKLCYLYEQFPKRFQFFGGFAKCSEQLPIQSLN